MGDDYFIFIYRKEGEQEVVYLKHVERQAQEKREEEFVQKYPAPQIITPLRYVIVFFWSEEQRRRSLNF